MYECVINQKCTPYVAIIYTFSSNHNIYKSLYGLCSWASELFIERFYKNISIKGHRNFNACCDVKIKYI